MSGISIRRPLNFCYWGSFCLGFFSSGPSRGPSSFGLGGGSNSHAPGYSVSSYNGGHGLGPRKCTYCHQENHTVDHCWDLHNRLAAHKKGKRTCTTHPITQFVSYGGLSPSFRAFVSSIFTSFPKSVSEALSVPQWRQAMVDEIIVLHDNGTW